jgi:hypothetical protein
MQFSQGTSFPLSKSHVSFRTHSFKTILNYVLKTRIRVSHPGKTDKITIIFTLILIFLTKNKKTEDSKVNGSENNKNIQNLIPG